MNMDTDTLGAHTFFMARAPQRTYLREALPPPLMDIDQIEQEARIGFALSLGLPTVEMLQDIASPGRRMMICGGGPSLADSLPRIKRAKADGWAIMALNVTHDWLLKNGVTPHFGAMLDPAERVAGYQTPTPGVVYLIGSTVHPSVWQRFREAGIKPFWFVAQANDTQHHVITRRFPHEDALFITGSTTIGMRAINLARYMGWQTIDLVGFDSCYAPGYEAQKKLYAYDKPHIHHDARELTAVSLQTGDRFSYIANVSMARQALGFLSFLQEMNKSETNGRIGGIRLVIHGDGVIPWMAFKDGGKDACFEHADPLKMLTKYGIKPLPTHWDYDKNMETEIK